MGNPTPQARAAEAARQAMEGLFGPKEMVLGEALMDLGQRTIDRHYEDPLVQETTDGLIDDIYSGSPPELKASFFMAYRDALVMTRLPREIRMAMAARVLSSGPGHAGMVLFALSDLASAYMDDDDDDEQEGSTGG